MEPGQSTITKRNELLDNDDELNEEENPILKDNPMSSLNDGPTDDPSSSPSAPNTSDGRDDLQQAYETAERQLAEKTQEAEQYRTMLEELGADARSVRRMADEEEFLKHVRKSYDHDPVDAFRMMVTRAQKELWDAVEERIHEAFREESDFKKRFADFLNDPSNTALKPYEQEMEFLIRTKGLTSDESATLVRTIADKRDLASGLRSAAAREIRSRSAVETGGEIGEPVDKDKEFFKIVKKAKTLDDMFESLRKTSAW